jgi:hypothetical protein
VRNTQNICRLQENDCELKPIDDCVANCRRDTSALFGKAPPDLDPTQITSYVLGWRQRRFTRSDVAP